MTEEEAKTTTEVPESGGTTEEATKAEPTDSAASVTQTEQKPKATTTTTDEFGRTKEKVEDDEPKVEFPSKRPLIDAEIELSYIKTLSPENLQIANKIAKVIVMIGNPSSRLNDAEINDMATKLFTEFSKFTEILLKMFFASMVRMSPQIESLAALIGVYCERFYKTYEAKLISKEIPDALKDAFQKDNFRVVKLLLRFLGAFVAYKLVTPQSFVNLLKTLADMVENATPCRGESLSRAIIVACKTAPAAYISEEDLEPIYEKIRNFVETRPNKFIQKFSPFKDQSTSFLDVLLASENLPHFTEAYVELFSRADTSKAESIPTIEFTFGEVDHAPFPFVVLQSIEEVTAGFDPVIADIADDILVFFGDDANLTADQMLALPMLLNYPSLKIPESNQNQNSHFIIPLFNAIILSDLLRIPSSYYPPAFHVCVFTNLIDMKKETEIIQQNLSPVILNIVNDISSLDPGCYFRFVRFFSHYISLYKFSWCWERWAGFTQLAENDMRLMFLRDVISHCYFLANPESITRALKDSFSSIMPTKPDIKIVTEFKENSDKLIEALTSGAESDNNSDNVSGVSSKFNDAYSELVGITGEFQALKIVISCIYFLGSGDSEKTINKIDEFRQLIQKFFVDKNAAWKRKLLAQTTIEFFVLMPPVLEEVLVYLIANAYIDVDNFLSTFLDKSSSDIVSSPESWEVFNIVINSIVAMHTANGRSKSAQDVVKSVFTYASDFFAAKDIKIESDSEKFIIGNLKEFGRSHYDIFASIDSEMNSLIAAEGVEEGFRDIITTISSFGSQ